VKRVVYLTFEMDPFADAVYVLVNDDPVASTVGLDPQRTLDYNAYGNIVGMEFLGVRRGVDLSNLPYRDALARYFGQYQVRVTNW
jgi:uncharacterized protein YuzE